MKEYGPKIWLCKPVGLGKWETTEHTLPENVRLVPEDRVDDARKRGYYTSWEAKPDDLRLPAADSRGGHSQRKEQLERFLAMYVQVVDIQQG